MENTEELEYLNQNWKLCLSLSLMNQKNHHLLNLVGLCYKLVCSPNSLQRSMNNNMQTNLCVNIAEMRLPNPSTASP